MNLFPRRYAVLVVEDDSMCRENFADAIRATTDLHLAGTAADAPDGLRMLEATQPDALLIDIGLPGGDGVDLIRYANLHLPSCESMVVSVFAEEHLVIQCIEAGATGYLLKDSSPIDIAQQIRLMRDGGSPITPAVARGLLKQLGSRCGEPARPSERRTAQCEARSFPYDRATLLAPEPAAVLSQQEHLVLQFSSKGYNYEEIAGVMKLSRHTVETYVKRIYRKLQVHSKTEAVYEARMLGLVED